ncbi:TonB-dependent receptor plug domain-containing protein [Chitinophaga barathri]|nr:TonB-dependent receptor plug domain-containing protein [Chitinophaga barathri]
MKHCLFLILLAIFIQRPAHAQLSEYRGMKEKVYVHTSHVYYKPGETMFFKVYVVKANTHRPSGVSGVVHVDILAPSGNVVQQLKLGVKDGYAEGSYDFTTTAPGGVYRLRAYTAWMQNEKESRWFTKEITLHRVVAPRVLMQLEFPGKGYGPGSEVTADFTMRNLAGKPITQHPTKYTVMLDGTSAGSGNFNTDKDGKAKIKFRLPETLASGNGLLNVTVQYDAYTESISRSIPIVLNKIDLQFMPEGGTFVEGITGVVAFRAVNEFGKAADVKGVITDSGVNMVAEFSSYHFGMGKFSFTPQPGHQYVAHITSPKGIDQRYPLPVAAKEGLAMHFSRDAKGLLLTLHSTHRQRVRIAGFSKDVLHFEQTVDVDAGKTDMLVDTTGFPAGIARFTALNAAGLPLAERVVFLQMNKKLRVTLTPDKTSYLPREKVTLKIKTENAGKQPIPANLSLSVIDDKLWTFADDKQDHILSWLLMSSELSGKVEEPLFYFKDDEPKALPALDLVMLTHGYRYFEYTREVEDSGRLRYLPEQSNVLNGVLQNTLKEPVAGGVYLVNARNSGRNDKVAYMETGKDGTFYFSGLEPQQTYFVVAGSFKKGEKVQVNITSNGIGAVPLRKPVPEITAIPSRADTIGPLEAIAAGTAVVEPPSPLNRLDGRSQNLEEVVVVAMGMQQSKRTLSGCVSIVTTTDLTTQSTVTQQLAGLMPGVQVVQQANPGAGDKILLRGQSTFSGNNSPLVILDGVPVSMDNMRMDPNEINNITVMKDQAAVAIYGSRAVNGVIIIESKRWIQKYIRLNLYKPSYYTTQEIWQNLPVFALAKKFYTPVYTSTEAAVRDDFRETIYWNPVLQTDRNGEATVSFYNSDATTTFRAIAEGIGYTGAPGRAELTYNAAHALAMDAKMPPAFTVGDKVLMPLNLKNNGPSPMTLHAVIIAPATVQVTGTGQAAVLRIDDKYGLNQQEFDLTLEAGGSKQVYIGVEALKARKETMLIRVSGNDITEQLEVPLEAVNKGFPMHEVFAGNKPARHTFTTSKVIPGSLQYNLRLFAGLEDQLLDGITSMLREPHGCFEQTSATTWPNVLILRLLRQRGKNNREVEDQALKYIKAGYERLVSFETKENGFEWFGRTPPHEGLTAMGLMEFTDMREFTEVDPRMMERTQKWLLSRRDGKGGFKRSEGGMDQFSGMSRAVANCYIVYALTQAGIGAGIEKEYQYALAQALENKDGYLIGLMAIAADNMKREADFHQLLALLNEGKLTAKTSVVSSRYASLEVEVTALHILALAREKAPRLDKMAILLGKVIKNKSHYGYGSTQGTVLALQAMAAYSARSGEVAANVHTSFMLNGKTIQPGVIKPEQATETPQAFDVSYSNGKEGVYYSMEVAYNTFTPPDSPKAELELETRLQQNVVKMGETVRLNISLANKRPALQPMAVAKIGIPAGLSIQPWQLKQLSEEKKIAYYELFDNYLVIYWMGFAPGETKTLELDLKADIPGQYRGKAATAYLYYMPEHKHWNEGLEVRVDVP